MRIGHGSSKQEGWRVCQSPPADGGVGPANRRAGATNSEGLKTPKQLNPMKTTLLTTCAIAALWAASATSGLAADDKKDKMHDGIMMKDGTVMVVKDGTATKMTKETELSDGSKVMTDGTVVAKDGEKTMLKEGDTVAMDGKMVKDRKLMDGYVMRKGKMMVVKTGKAAAMTVEAVLKGGVKVMTDGTVMMKDGVKKVLNNGDRVTEDGEVVEGKRKKDAK